MAWLRSTGGSCWIRGTRWPGPGCPVPTSARPDPGMPEIIVTGAAGFIGSYVAAALLDRGEQVLGLDSLNAYYDPALKQARLRRLEGRNGFRFRRVDIADETALKEALADALPKARRMVHA